jgi:hypothetical protein
MTPRQITAFYIVGGVVSLVTLLVAFINRRPFDLREAERTAKEFRGSDMPWYLRNWTPREVHFVEFLPAYPWVACSAPAWASILVVLGYRGWAFGLTFFLFCFGLMSTRALETIGRPARLHYISCILAFLTMGLIALIMSTLEP